jgi:hypothetical protein
VRLDEIPPPEGLPAPVKDLVRRLDTDDGVRHLWWTIVAVGVLALAVFVGRGGSRPKDPSLDRGSSIGVTVTGPRHTSTDGYDERPASMSRQLETLPRTDRGPARQGVGSTGRW